MLLKPVATFRSMLKMDAKMEDRTLETVKMFAKYLRGVLVSKMH